jgi:hypothetical protein
MWLLGFTLGSQALQAFALVASPSLGLRLFDLKKWVISLSRFLVATFWI